MPSRANSDEIYLTDFCALQLVALTAFIINWPRVKDIVTEGRSLHLFQNLTKVNLNGHVVTSKPGIRKNYRTIQYMMNSWNGLPLNIRNERSPSHLKNTLPAYLNDCN